MLLRRQRPILHDCLHYVSMGVMGNSTAFEMAGWIIGCCPGLKEENLNQEGKIISVANTEQFATLQN